MEGKITYFDKVGPDNTEVTLKIAKQRADELGIKTILIASTRGDVAARAVDVFNGCKVVAVGHAYGYREPNKNEFTDENRKKVESKGGAVVFAQHALTGLTRRPTPPPAPGTPPAPLTGPILEIPDIIASTLRMISAGIKVVVECGAMAADAGQVPTDQDIIAIAGSGRGADTAVVMRASTSRDLFRTRVNEILCKPLVYAAGGPPRPPAAAGVPAEAGARRPA
ncbi:MAG: hypothetical protein HYX80_10165 [Chloroflexi bacterium]|nr:hypothetical protein [Chloroflexota bacterium]